MPFVYAGPDRWTNASQQDIALGAWRAVVIAFSLFSFVCVTPAGAADKLLSVGTSSKSGVYYPVGQALCDAVNAGRDQHLRRCLAYNTGGSIYNINALVSGETDISITKADLADDAYRGEILFSAHGPNKNLRMIANLYGEPVTVIVHKDSSINSFSELLGKRINIGNRGSGKRSTATNILKIMGWNIGQFAEIHELPTGAMGEAFCAGKIDVLIESMGIPSKFYDFITSQCGARFLPLPEKVIAGFKKLSAAFYSTEIKGGLYPQNPDSVSTVGMKVVLVTTNKISNESIAVVARALLSEKSHFRHWHPSLTNSTPVFMTDTQGVPMHDGALSYYRKMKLLP